MTVSEKDVLINVTASLVAAISLLERGGRRAAASDKRFDMMLEDYRLSVKEARVLLQEEHN